MRPPLEKARTVCRQLGLELERESDHDHLEAAGPMSPLDFAARLLAYCFRFRGSCSGWGRTNAYNASPAIRGDPDSKHQDWLGADVVYD